MDAKAMNPPPAGEGPHFAIWHKGEKLWQTVLRFFEDEDPVLFPLGGPAWLDQEKFEVIKAQLKTCDVPEDQIVIYQLTKVTKEE